MEVPRLKNVGTGRTFKKPHMTHLRLSLRRRHKIKDLKNLKIHPPRHLQLPLLHHHTIKEKGNEVMRTLKMNRGNETRLSMTFIKSNFKHNLIHFFLYTTFSLSFFLKKKYMFSSTSLFLHVPEPLESNKQLSAISTELSQQITFSNKLSHTQYST